MLRERTKLNRWSIARAIRSGRPLNWPAFRTKACQPPLSSIPSSANVAESPPSISDDFENNGKMPEGKAIRMVSDGTGCTAETSVSAAALGQFEHCLHDRRRPVHAHPFFSIPSSANVDESPPSISDDFENNGKMPEGKAIYMVSDGTGWTAEHSVSAALGQFEHYLHNRRCPVRTHLFSAVRDMDRLMEIIKQAGKEGALVLYTLADPLLAKSVEQACKLWGVPSTDILRPTTEAIASHFGVAPLGIPRGAPGRKSPITEEFLRRNEAIAFTIRQDDGARPEYLSRAHIVLVGVSRTGKTPLAIYLAQKGYKVANVPIVMGAELPETLFEIDQEKVFGLTIDPVVLQSIRNARIKNLKLETQMRSNYSEMDHVRKELEYAKRIFTQNPVWPVIDITGRAVEETAAIVVRMYHDRKQKNAFSRISKQY